MWSRPKVVCVNIGGRVDEEVLNRFLEALLHLPLRLPECYSGSGRSKKLSSRSNLAIEITVGRGVCDFPPRQKTSLTRGEALLFRLLPNVSCPSRLCLQLLERPHITSFSFYFNPLLRLLSPSMLLLQLPSLPPLFFFLLFVSF